MWYNVHITERFWFIEQSIFPRLQLIFPIKKPETACQKLVKMKDTTSTSVKRLYDEKHIHEARPCPFIQILSRFYPNVIHRDTIGI